MTNSFRTVLSILLCLITFLGACSLPTTYTPTAQPTSTAEDAPYTAAAATIAAQLTDIAIANTTGIAPADDPMGSTPENEPVQPEFSETLPATSTPLPTKTPLPSDTPTPTNTPEPTSTPTITRTPAPTEEATEPAFDPRNVFGEPDWQDNFTDAFNWPIYNDEHVEMRITVDDRLEMTSLEADKWESWMLMTSSPVMENFYLEAVASPGECRGSDRYGMVVRSIRNASKFYSYGLTCDGRYSFRAWDGETFTNIIPWTPSDSINTGNNVKNVIGLLAEGNQFSLYANGNLLTSVQDDTYTEGLFGLFVGGPDTEGFVVWFDQVSYWLIQPE